MLENRSVMSENASNWTHIIGLFDSKPRPPPPSTPPQIASASKSFGRAYMEWCVKMSKSLSHAGCVLNNDVIKYWGNHNTINLIALEVAGFNRERKKRTSKVLKNEKPWFCSQSKCNCTNRFFCGVVWCRFFCFCWNFTFIQ